MPTEALVPSEWLRKGRSSVDHLEPIRLPVALPLWVVADLEAYRAELHGRLGAPHRVDPEGSGLGIEHVWAFALKPTGQRVLVELYLPHGGTGVEWIVGQALLYADPPDLEPVLEALGIERTDSRLRTFPPVPVR